MRLQPRETVGKFLPTDKDVLGVPRWPQMVCFVFMGVFPVSRFVLFWCFRSGIVLAGICIFFCVLIPFFTSLREQIVPVVLVAFFVVVVLDLIFWFSWSYFYVLSLCYVLLILDMVNTWCCMFLLRYFCFFCLLFLSILLFVFCMCLQVSLRTFAVFVVQFNFLFCRSFLFVLLLRPIRPNCVACVDHRWRLWHTYPSDSQLLFLPVFPFLSCVVPSHNGHPWSFLPPFRAPTLN
jgi:hypothetical protein